MTADVVIAGGGVIGLSIAYLLAREGIGATVLDRGELGREASWAGAGILAPEAERPGSPLGKLRARSARLHAEWAEALRGATGIDNGYRRCGGVDVAIDAGEEQALRAIAGRWRDEGIAFERLEPRDFDRVEPALGRDLRVAYFLPDRAQIRNPRHLRALASAAAALGARLRPGLAAEGFEVAANGRITAVRTAEGPFSCGAAVVAAGAWSAGLLEGLGLHVPTPPVKGQIVLLRTEGPVLRRVVEHGKNYLVPRDDGRVLVGATEEYAGFDTRPTGLAARDLLAEAIRLCPALAPAELERCWAGLRPGSLDGRPYLGPAPGHPNLYLATGHRRAGLQLSTASAEVIADLIAGRPPRLDWTSFRPGRDAREEEDVFRS
ncbi:MAG TPA: glycine oxidase ThiO [Isosphaeraceae bacterium]|jgi:glycine oxidase|nr:glycine oxidase ThiO [Isosphaeraceae bacterium]